MAISRAQLFKELIPGLKGLFGLEYKRYDNQHAEIFSTESSERSFEEELKLSGFAAAPTTREGEGLLYDAAQEAWTARYNHETVKMGFAITEEAMEDNLYESLSARYTKALARSMAYTKQVKAASTLNRAFTSTYSGGDGKELLATDHPLISGGVNANEPASGVDLNETALENAAIGIAAWTDERGLLIAAKPRKLIIPPALQFTATRLLETQMRLATADNDISAIVNNGTIPGGYKVNNFLTDTNAWFIITDVPDGLKHFQRVGISTGKEGDFETGNLKFKARERYSFGWTDPLGIYGSPGSS